MVIYANNNDVDKPSHLHSLIYILQLVICLTWWKTQNTTFLMTMLKNNPITLLLICFDSSKKDAKIRN